MLVGRIVTSALAGRGSQIVHATVNKARDPLAGVFEARLDGAHKSETTTLLSGRYAVDYDVVSLAPFAATL